MPSLRALALAVVVSGCLQAGPALPTPDDTPAASTFSPFEGQARIPYAVMGGPVPFGSMAMMEIPLPEGATAAALLAEWSPSTPASERLMVMMHAGTMAQAGPMLGGSAGASPREIEPAFVPEGETSLVVMAMPEGEPAGSALAQDVGIRVDFFRIERPPAPPRTYVDVSLGGPEGAWNVSLWDAPHATVSVLLVGGNGQARTDWEPYALALRDAGVRAMATDGLGPGDESAALAALDALRSLGSPRVAIAGASLGAEAALLAAASGPECPSGLAQLSPVPDRAEPGRPALAFKEYGERPLFLAVAQGDSFSYPTAQEHRLLARGEVAYVERPGAAHGTDLLEDADVRDGLARWLEALAPCAA